MAATRVEDASDEDAAAAVVDAAVDAASVAAVVVAFCLKNLNRLLLRADETNMFRTGVDPSSDDS